MSRCKVEFNDQSGRKPDIDRKRIQRVVDAACAEAKRDTCSLTVLLVTSAESAKLHKAHFKKSDATDVMTFPDGALDPESKRTHLGDLAVCPDVARDAAAMRGLAERDEITRYVLHGLLHLFGYDDTTPAKAKKMWAAQRRLMRKVGLEISED